MALLLASLGTALLATPASAQIVFDTFEVEFTEEDGSPATQAGSHPFAMTTTFEVQNTTLGPGEFEVSGAAKDLW
jgi:hypothetical protein